MTLRNVPVFDTETKEIHRVKERGGRSALDVMSEEIKAFQLLTIILDSLGSGRKRCSDFIESNFEQVCLHLATWKKDVIFTRKNTCQM